MLIGRFMGWSTRVNRTRITRRQMNDTHMKTNKKKTDEKTDRDTGLAFHQFNSIL
jgi:hypothetical protein